MCAQCPITPITLATLKEGLKKITSLFQFGLGRRNRKRGEANMLSSMLKGDLV